MYLLWQTLFVDRENVIRHICRRLHNSKYKLCCSNKIQCHYLPPMFILWVIKINSVENLPCKLIKIEIKKKINICIFVKEFVNPQRPSLVYFTGRVYFWNTFVMFRTFCSRQNSDIVEFAMIQFVKIDEIVVCDWFKFIIFIRLNLTHNM